ncbi:hypothetical protein NTGZN8_110009 [Candidatus Nitrotoga fabula]|uniref:Uncharacterized protein n=1 Tax=Candidatus Nitrotoga fabula TaxID=2182327 RepID=A0A916F8T5_9PROT|nr:hypothetical protein NTGZN8_110009 [Candidatus Nitrotoga fabula]
MARLSRKNEKPGQWESPIIWLIGLFFFCSTFQGQFPSLDLIHQLSLDPGYIPVTPPKSNQQPLWEYDLAMYRKENEGERLF